MPSVCVCVCVCVPASVCVCVCLRVYAFVEVVDLVFVARQKIWLMLLSLKRNKYSGVGDVRQSDQLNN